MQISTGTNWKMQVKSLQPVLRLTTRHTSTRQQATCTAMTSVDRTCSRRSWIHDGLQKGADLFSYKKGKCSPYSITKHRVPELIPILGSQPAGDVSHKPSCRLPLLSARPAVTSAALKRAATNFAVWWTEAQWVWTVCLRLLPDSVVTAIWTRVFCAWVQHANHSATEPPVFV